jgi:hypothetical protein
MNFIEKNKKHAHALATIHTFLYGECSDTGAYYGATNYDPRYNMTRFNTYNLVTSSL